MKKLTFFNILCIFFTTSQAQVQFVSVANNFSGTSSLKVASFKSDSTSALLHDFKIADPTDCNGVIKGLGGKLYGTTFTGGSYYNGSLFSVNTDGTNFKIIYHYKNKGTAVPPAISSDGKLYVIISESLYTIAVDGSSLTFINKVAPSCKRIVISEDQWIYGCGVENNSRILFRIKTDGSGYIVLHSFDRNTEGMLDVVNSLVCITPTGRIFLTCGGAINSDGILASMRTDGSDFKINKNFTIADQINYGIQPLTSGAVYHYNGKIIFTMFSGGDYGGGTIVSFDTLTSTLTKIFSFPSVNRTSNAIQPQVIFGKLVGLNSNGLYSVTLDGTDYQQINTLPLSGYPILNFDTSINRIFYSANGGTFKNSQLIKIDVITNIASTIHSFGNLPEGYNPDGIIRVPNGVLYGIARNGGSEGGGTLFKMNTDGSAFSVIKDFAGNNGQSPVGQLLYASDNRLYGVCTKSGISGASDSMLIYGIDCDGKNYFVLRTFDTKNEGNLIPELSESSSGEIAGLIGPSGRFPPPPKIFKLKKNGTEFVILHTLSLTGADGYYPKHGLVVYNGYFYGVNTSGGMGGQANGSIFRIKEDGTNFTVFKYFNNGGPDGSKPEGGLTLGPDNKLYGVTNNDGLNYLGTAFSLNPSDLTFQVIYNFVLSDGFLSVGKFTKASDGKLYIARATGIFRIDPNGSNAVLISSTDFNFQPAVNEVGYLTEIPLLVTTELCAPIASTILTSDINGINHQWQMNTATGFVSIIDNSNYVGTNTNTIKLNNIPSSWNGYQYRCLIDEGAGKTFTLKFINSWTGSLNNRWENSANWSCGSIPDINTDVIINSGTVVINSNVSIRSLKINSGVNITVNGGFNLSITH